MIESRVRLLAVIAISALLDIFVSATGTINYYRQEKNVIPVIQAKHSGITCDMIRTYLLTYLKSVAEQAHFDRQKNRKFPIKFGVFQYEIKGPYYIYPVFMDRTYKNYGRIGPDFVVIDSQGSLMGAIVVKSYDKNLVYHPCLPQRASIDLDPQDTVLSILLSAVDSPGSSNDKANKIGVISRHRKDKDVGQSETAPQSWNPFAPPEYWNFNAKEFFDSKFPESRHGTNSMSASREGGE